MNPPELISQVFVFDMFVFIKGIILANQGSFLSQRSITHMITDILWIWLIGDKERECSPIQTRFGFVIGWLRFPRGLDAINPHADLFKGCASLRVSLRISAGKI